MSRPSTVTLHIRRSLDIAAIGGAFFCAALVTGLLMVIPAGAAVGLGCLGFVLWLVGIRELLRAVRMRKEERTGGP